MQVILGVIFHFIGGFASGSFYMPYKKVRGWAWESLLDRIGGIFFPGSLCHPLRPGSPSPTFCRDHPADQRFHTVIYLYFWIALGRRRTYVWSGSSLPWCLSGKQHHPGSLHGLRCTDPFCLLRVLTQRKAKILLSMIVGSTWGLTGLLGLAICIMGIILCGRAGTMKEKQLKANIRSGMKMGKTRRRISK
jgi:L-rhamnose-H+ transport protein